MFREVGVVTSHLDMIIFDCYLDIDDDIFRLARCTVLKAILHKNNKEKWCHLLVSNLALDSEAHLAPILYLQFLEIYVLL